MTTMRNIVTQMVIDSLNNYIYACICIYTYKHMYTRTYICLHMYTYMCDITCHRLNKNGTHGCICLNTQFKVSGTAWEGLGGVVLL